MKATVRCHYTLIRKAKRKKSDKINADEKAENPERSYAAEGNVKTAQPLWKSLVVS